MTPRDTMINTAKNVLLAELYSASGYLDRLFHALLELTDLGKGTEARLIGERLFVDVYAHLSTKVLKHEQDFKPQIPMGLSEIKASIQASQKLMESQVKLGFHSPEVLVEEVVPLINIFYSYGHELHQLVSLGSDLEVQLPRVNLIEIHFEVEETVEDHLSPYQEDFEEWDNEEIPSFHLSEQHVLNVINNQLGDITSLEWQRNKKYDSLIQESHEAVYKKDHGKALELFKKALNYRETAEVLTLIGWVYSLDNDYNEAKSYCLKAIKCDPDYGPPYNDLGSYLLAEGQVGESLKWFDMAKKATHYQNREYPYINAGRAYMARNEYQMALEEFSKALTLAPFHDELHVTVEKLKKSLQKGKVKDQGLDFEDPPPLS